MPGGHTPESTLGTNTKAGPALTWTAQKFADQPEEAKIDSVEGVLDAAEASFRTIDRYQSKRASPSKVNQYQPERISSLKINRHQPKKNSPSSSTGREKKKRDSTPASPLKSATPCSISETKKQRRTEVGKTNICYCRGLALY